MRRRGDQAAEQAAIQALVAAAIQRLTAKVKLERMLAPASDAGRALGAEIDDCDARIDAALMDLLKADSEAEAEAARMAPGGLSVPTAWVD